jgi:hypothetical protein
VLKVARAVPAARAEPSEGGGFSGFGADGSRDTRRLEGLESGSNAGANAGTGGGAADPARSIAALEAQAAELEHKAKDLRGRIASLKLKTQPVEPAPKDTTAGAGSSH